jgi:hypothetical protein
MITLRPKLWGPVLVVCFCLVCNVGAADRTNLESSFLRKVQMVLESLQEYGLDIKAHPEKAVKYDKLKASEKESKLQTAKMFPQFAESYYKEAEDIKPWKALNSIYSDKFTYDIRGINSLISPYVGIVTFYSQYWTKEGRTKEECLMTPWKKSFSFKETRKFFYQSGKWIPDEKPYIERDTD